MQNNKIISFLVLAAAFPLDYAVFRFMQLKTQHRFHL